MSSNEQLKSVAKLVAAFVIGSILVAFFWPSHQETVAEYKTQLIAAVNQDLSNQNNWIRKKIEDAHVTVTSKSANVTSCSVYTVDGSDKAGKGGKNISEVDFVITVYWSGWIQDNGYTEFEVDYDNQGQKVKDTKYLRSNALINMDTVDWFSVGYQVGAFIAQASL